VLLSAVSGAMCVKETDPLVWLGATGSKLFTEDASQVPAELVQFSSDVLGPLPAEDKVELGVGLMSLTLGEPDKEECCVANL